MSTEPVTVVIFGGAGDLAHRKLLPALYNLCVDGVLPSGTAIVGVGRKDFSDDQYREFARSGVEQFSRRGIDEAFLTNSIVDNHPLFVGIEVAGTAAM